VASSEAQGVVHWPSTSFGRPSQYPCRQGLLLAEPKNVLVPVTRGGFKVVPRLGGSIHKGDA